jgi:hypothetical protein
VYIVEENGQVSYNFLTIGLKDAQMLSLTQEQINPNLYFGASQFGYCPTIKGVEAID